MEYRWPILKSLLYATSLSQKIYISICFASQKKSEDGFCFYKKKKAKSLCGVPVVLLILFFCSKPLKRQLELGLSGATKRLPEELHSASGLHSFELSMSFILICSVNPLARWISRYLFLFFFLMPFWLMKDLVGTVCFWVVGENCIHIQSIKPIPDWLG